MLHQTPSSTPELQFGQTCAMHDSSLASCFKSNALSGWSIVVMAAQSSTRLHCLPERRQYISSDLQRFEVNAYDGGGANASYLRISLNLQERIAYVGTITHTTEGIGLANLVDKACGVRYSCAKPVKQPNSTYPATYREL